MGEPGAFVLGSDYRALGIVRSLGRRGIPVVVADVGGYPIATRSRYVRATLPWPGGSEEEVIAHLLDLAGTRGLAGWTLFPSSDTAASLLARHSERLSERYVVAAPPWDVLRWAYDKRLTYRLAAEIGLPCPRTLCPRDRRDVERASCAFPVILKPAVKEVSNAFTDAKAWRVDDRAELLRRYDRAAQLVDPRTILIQELIPGNGHAAFSYAALCRDGRPVESLVARRMRQYPMDFGRFSTYVETVDEPRIEAAARRLLERMGMSGLVEVEFKRDERTGVDQLLDVNARIWGWHTLGERAGVDFAHGLWCELHGRPVPERRAPPGVRWMWLLTDLPVSAGELLHRRLSVRGYLASFRRPLELAIEARDDPGPVLGELPLLGQPIMHRLRSTLNGRP